MIGAKETTVWLQIHALEQIRAGQAATVATVRAWTRSTAIAAPPLVPGWPSGMTGPAHTAEAKASAPSAGSGPVGDLKEVVDSWFAFAHEILELNRQFAHRLLLASRPREASADGGWPGTGCQPGRVSSHAR